MKRVFLVVLMCSAITHSSQPSLPKPKPDWISLEDIPYIESRSPSPEPIQPPKE